MADNTRRAAGFTLIELTIVIVVLGISAGLVLPALSGLLSREGEKTAARVIQGTLRRAQAEALLTGRAWRVELDWAAGQCSAVQVEEDPSALAPTAARQAVVRASPGTPSRADAGKAGPKAAVTTTLPGKPRPRLVATDHAMAVNPDRTSLVLLPEGLCQPAFIRLPDTTGRETALSISAVGCRVDLLHSDLDKAQERFEKTHGQPRTPWADAVPGPRS